MTKMFNNDLFLSYVQKYVNKDGKLSMDTFGELVECLGESEIELAMKTLADNGVDVVEDASFDSSDYSVYTDLLALSNEMLCVMYQNGDSSALEALCAKNEGFVRKVANRCYWNYKPATLELEDLYVQGFIGLMKAAEKFDVSKGFMFTTYSHWWIMQTITREIMDNGSIIRLPVHVHEQIIVINKCRSELVYYSISNLRDKLESDYGKSYTIENLRTLITWGDAYLKLSSLDLPVGEDGDSKMMDFIPTEYSVEDEVAEGFMKETIADCMRVLTERESKVINLRFGLKNGIPMTLEEVGNAMGVTRERIRQIEAKAIRKLQRSSVSAKLEGLYAA